MNADQGLTSATTPPTICSLDPLGRWPSVFADSTPPGASSLLPNQKGWVSSRRACGQCGQPAAAPAGLPGPIRSYSACPRVVQGGRGPRGRAPAFTGPPTLHGPARPRGPHRRHCPQAPPQLAAPRVATLCIVDILPLHPPRRRPRPSTTSPYRPDQSPPPTDATRAPAAGRAPRQPPAWPHRRKPRGRRLLAPVGLRAWTTN